MAVSQLPCRRFRRYLLLPAEGFHLPVFKGMDTEGNVKALTVPAVKGYFLIKQLSVPQRMIHINRIKRAVYHFRQGMKE